MVNHYKSHITKLELEKEDLKRELSRKMNKVGFLSHGLHVFNCKSILYASSREHKNLQFYFVNKMKTLQQTQFGAGPSQSLQLALEFSGQVRAEYSKTCSNASICTHMTIDQAAMIVTYVRVRVIMYTVLQRSGTFFSLKKLFMVAGAGVYC